MSGADSKSPTYSSPPPSSHPSPLHRLSSSSVEWWGGSGTVSAPLALALIDVLLFQEGCIWVGMQS